MNKYLVACSAAAMAVACANASAQDAGAFFINAGVGQGQYHVGHTDGVDDKDTAGALRFGYAWKVAEGFHLGVEGGYANLGKLVAEGRLEYRDGTVVNDKVEVETRGWLLGADGKYTFGGRWFLSARAGWFRSTADNDYRNEAVYSDGSRYVQYDSADADGDGWYGGVGVGYDFAPNFSLGLNYDNYHSKTKDGLDTIEGNIGVYTATAEFRF
jgi:hypothetical protein